MIVQQGQSKAPYCRMAGKNFWVLELMMGEDDKEQDLYDILSDTAPGDWMFVSWAHHQPSKLQISLMQQTGQMPERKLAGALIAVPQEDVPAWVEAHSQKPLVQ